MKSVRNSNAVLVRVAAVVVGAALVLTMGVSPSAVAQSGQGGSSLNDNPPPFDFNDAFYTANGINLGQLNGSPTALRFGFSPEGVPIRQTGTPAGPGQVNWVVDNTNTDPDRNNIRILATTGGYKDDTGSPTQFINIIAFLNDRTFFAEENRDPHGTGNARGVTMETIAGNFEAYAALKQVGPDGVFRPTPCASIGDQTQVAIGNCFSVQSVTTPKLRQDWRFSTNRSAIDGSANFSYNGDNLVGLWIITYHWYTAAGFGPLQTPDCKAALAFLAERNSLSLDGTPIIKSGAELHFVENNLQGNEGNDFPPAPTNACAMEGNLDFFGRDGGAVWLVCPSIPDATRGAIAADAFVDAVRKQDGSPLDPQISASFSCLQKNGQFCGLANGTYMVKNQASGLFWDGSSPSGEGTVQLAALNTGAGGTSQQWAFTTNTDGTYQIVNKANGLSLSDPQSSNASGTALIQANADRSADQKWVVMPLNNGFRITSAASHLAIDATSGVPGAGTIVVQATPTGDTEQVWVIH